MINGSYNHLIFNTVNVVVNMRIISIKTYIEEWQKHMTKLRKTQNSAYLSDSSCSSSHQCRNP